MVATKRTLHSSLHNLLDFDAAAAAVMALKTDQNCQILVAADVSGSCFEALIVSQMD